MSTQPLTSIRYRALDANGNPLSGGALYTYAAGTSTPLATYTTSAGDAGSTNTNPVVLDANGEADVWLSPGVDYKFVLKDANGVTQDTVDNWPSPEESVVDSGAAILNPEVTDPGGRLTLTTGTPVTTSDVSGSTVYYVPHKHDKVPLYDGTSWTLYSIGNTGVSQLNGDTTKSPAAVVGNTNYDLFVWNDAGTIRVSRGPAWTSATARGTGAGTSELQQVNGRYVNKVGISNGPSAQCGLYVGTVRSDGSSNINDSLAKRHVWNNYNRVERAMRVTEATASWNYTTATLRQANGAAANQVDLVRGLDEDAVEVEVSALASNGSTTNVVAGIGLDSTSAMASGCVTRGGAVIASGGYSNLGAAWRGLPGLGRHFFAWLEWSAAVGTTTWTGNGGGVPAQTGIHATMRA